MKVWRTAAALVLVLVAGAPLVVPLVELVGRGPGTWAAADLRRVVSLYRETFLLVAGVLALVMPAGILLAAFAFRAVWPGRRLFLWGCGLMLFVPPALQVSAWQSLLGPQGILGASGWGVSSGRPWTAGLWPAIWVHALAALPWVVFLVGMAMARVERELEEAALLQGPPRWVLWTVTLPRCRGAMLLAGLWVALQASGDIAVTDMFQVFTIAEEVHTQFTEGDEEALARALTAALPLLALAWLAAAWLGPRLDAVAPPLAARWLEPRPLPWGPAARGAGIVLSLGVLALVALPLASLADKVGRAGWPPAWSAEVAWQFFGNEARLHGADTLANAVLAALVAAAVSFLAWLACWLAQQSAPLRRLLFAIVALSWALPGPIIGIGLKTSIAWIVDRFPGGVVEQVFYQGPSPLPLAWAWGVRFFPFAAALLWPVVRLTPRESIEALRLESGSPWREFWVGFVPHTWRAYVLAALALTALSLAEVAASVRVDTPGWESYSKLLFDRMHYGVENNVAALALVLLLIVGAAAAALAAVVADIHKLCRRSR